MVGWYQLFIPTEGWDETRITIGKAIKPVVEALEPTKDIISFFFLRYYGDEHGPRIQFWFYGNKDRVFNEFNKYIELSAEHITKFDPASLSERFGEDYFLGIKLFELGSRLALCKIDDKNPTDAKGYGPITYTLVHAFLQNLGYDAVEEDEMFNLTNHPLESFHNLYITTHIK
jgi:hypothetical protein